MSEEIKIDKKLLYREIQKLEVKDLKWPCNVLVILLLCL